jgi:hypothetical protein
LKYSQIINIVSLATPFSSMNCLTLTSGPDSEAVAEGIEGRIWPLPTHSHPTLLNFQKSQVTVTWMTWNDMNDVKWPELHEMTWNDMKWHKMTWNDMTWIDMNSHDWHELHDIVTRATKMFPWSSNESRRHSRGTYLFLAQQHGLGVTRPVSYYKRCSTLVTTHLAIKDCSRKIDTNDRTSQLRDEWLYQCDI